MSLDIRRSGPAVVYVPGAGQVVSGVQQQQASVAGVVAQQQQQQRQPPKPSFDARAVAEDAVRSVLGEAWLELAECIAPLLSSAGSEEEARRLAEKLANNAKTMLIQEAKAWLDKLFNPRGAYGFTLAFLVTCVWGLSKSMSGEQALEKCVARLSNPGWKRFGVQVQVDGGKLKLPGNKSIPVEVVTDNILAAHLVLTRGPAVIVYNGERGEVKHLSNPYTGTLKMRIIVEKPNNPNAVFAVALFCDVNPGTYLHTLMQYRGWYPMIGIGAGEAILHPSLRGRRELRFVRHPLDPCPKGNYDSEWRRIPYPFAIASDPPPPQRYRRYYIGSIPITLYKPYYDCYRAQWDSNFVAHAIIEGCRDPRQRAKEIDPYGRLLKKPPEEFKQQAVQSVCTALKTGGTPQQVAV